MADPFYREDFLPLRAVVDSKTGYLTDTPVLVRTGVYEYRNPTTGKTEREFRPASVVFDRAHLKALRGTPIVATHAAGLISAKNAKGHTVGVILSEGRQDGENLVAEIMLHDPSPVLRDGMKELSLGYQVEVDETPGTWNGERYDRSITKIGHVNHLAIVRKGRAGVARLNMDQQDRTDDVPHYNSAAAARQRMYGRIGREDSALERHDSGFSGQRFDAKQREIETKSGGHCGASAAPSPHARQAKFVCVHPRAGADQPRGCGAGTGDVGGGIPRENVSG